MPAGGGLASWTPEPVEDDDDVVDDHAVVKVARVVGPGDEFSLTFDLGDRWEHRCRELPDSADPRPGMGLDLSSTGASQPLTSIWIHDG